MLVEKRFPELKWMITELKDLYQKFMLTLVINSL